MPLSCSTIGRLVVVIASSVAASQAAAELIKVSPFLPPQSAVAAPTQNAPLEYRGSMEVDNVEQYRIVDPSRKVGTWLKVGERDDNLNLVLKQHDADRETVVVEQGGQTMTLAMKAAKVVSAGHVPQMVAPAVPQPAPNVSPAVLQTVVPNPTPADESRRLEAVAAEVARRRALREQAAQQAAQNAAGAVPPPNVTRHDLQQAQRR